MDEFASGYRAPMIALSALRWQASDGGTETRHGLLRRRRRRGQLIAEFPSVQAAQDWHESDAYKAIIPCRDKHITASYVIAEGM